MRGPSTFLARKAQALSDVRRLAALPALVLGLAACGGGEEARPLPETIEGEVTVQQLEGNPEAGEALFASQGCNGCHAFEAAGSTAEVGPSLDEDLEGNAEDAGQELAAYVNSSLVNPNAYVVEGYQEGVMPSYASLERQQLADLVAFITQDQ
jgi:mono/diheme cytochrome c family protein